MAENTDFAAAIAAALKAVGIGGSGAGKTVSSEAIKLTTASAKQLLQTMAADAGYTGTFTSDDIAAFVASYNKMANEQLDTIVRDTRETIKSGTTADAAATIQNIITTKYPSYFDPKTFTKDFIWSKVNFKDEKTLGPKALDALTTARGIAKAYNLSSVSDTEIQDAAKKIASGKLTADDYKTQLAAKAAIEYPQYAERLKTTPGATVRDLVNPVLKAVADAWEVDVNSLDLNDPFIDKLIRPDGTVGKKQPASVGEALQAAMMHSNRNKTVAENNNARDAATELSKALGFGV
jgi:hypothetical protein